MNVVVQDDHPDHDPEAEGHCALVDEAAAVFPDREEDDG